jgi:hypothetical protein
MPSPPVGALGVRADLRKEIEYATQVFRRNADAVVGDADHAPEPLACDRHDELAAGLGVFGAVREQVREHLRQPIRIPEDAQIIVGAFDRHLVAAARYRGRATLETGSHDLPQRQRLPLQLNLAGADAPHVHQVVDEPYEMSELSLHHRNGGLQRLGARRGRAHDLQAIAQGEERIAQLVRESREEFVLAPLRFRVRALARFAPRNVLEQHGDLVLRGLADRERVAAVPRPQRARLELEMLGDARLRDATVQFEPVLFEMRLQLAHGAAFHVAQAGLPFERLIDLDEAVVARRAVRVEHDLDDAEAAIDALKSGVIAIVPRATAA